MLEVPDYATAAREAYKLRPVSTLRAPFNRSFDLDEIRYLLERGQTHIDEGTCSTAMIEEIAFAHAQLGNKKELKKTLAHDRFLSAKKMPNATPDFLANIVAELKTTQRKFIRSPERATTKAWRSEDIFTRAHPNCMFLKTMLEGEINAYIRRLKDDGHPFVRNAPNDFWIYAWAIFSNKDGYLKPHVHMRGWLSGVFYIQCPPCVANKRRKLGWFNIVPPNQITDDMGWDTLSIQPEPGLLLLMPSYYRHCTTPTGTRSPRIVIAFDVFPRSSPHGRS